MTNAIAGREKGESESDGTIYVDATGKMDAGGEIAQRTRSNVVTQ